MTTIGSDAFYGCTGLTSFAIPNSVKKIGRFAFSRCTNLQKIVVEEYNEVYDSRNGCNAIIETASNKIILACKKLKYLLQLQQ